LGKVRTYKVELCERKEITAFIEEWHYSKNVNGLISDYCFKLLDGETLIGGMIYGPTVLSDAQAYSGNNSWNIEDTSGGTATLDLGWNNDMDFLTEGTWSMSLMMLVPTGTTGGFFLYWQGGGFLVADADADTVHLVAGGTWTDGDKTPLVRDQWVMYEMVFDGGTGVTTHYYNGIELGSDTSSEAGFGRFGGWVDPAIAGGWYIDDIALLQLQ